MLWICIRIASNTHPKHMILWKTYDNQGKTLFFLLYEYGDVHLMVLQTACQWWVTAS